MTTLPTVLFTVGVGSLVAWLLVLAGIMIATRPRSVRPDPPTDALGSSRPAVVNLLVNRWRCTTDAARATLTDLIGRGYLTVRRDGPDPTQVTIEIRDESPPNLTRYERRLLARLRTQARGGRVSLPALAFHTEWAASRWLSRFATEVVADAKARDVAKAGVNPDFLLATALVPALTLGGWTYLRVPTDKLFSAVAVLVAVLLILAQLGVRVRDRHRPTRYGRSAAAHWLGVRSHLREQHPNLAEVSLDDPLAAEPRTGYGVALSLAATISEQVQFAPVRTRRVAGLRVVFPRWLRFCWGWGALGCATSGLGALLTALVGAILIQGYGDHVPDIVRFAGWLAVAASGLAGLGLLGLATADAIGTRDATGTVILLEWYGDSPGSSRYVFAMTDGERDRLDAWILPSYLGEGLALGSTVNLRVRPWTGLVDQLAIVRGPEPTRPPETAPDATAAT
jgi:hypothetical protein